MPVGCARRAVNAAEQPVRIFVTDARLDRLSLYAAAVKERQTVSPTIWLLVGDPFAEGKLNTLNDGAAEVVLLNRAGVDAVVLTPAWLAFGLPRLKEIVASGHFYSLSANLLDTTGQTVGYPFMVKRSGSATIAIAGLALDSNNVLLRAAGVRYSAPGYAAAKTVALMRQRSDLVGVMVEPRSAASDRDADFTVNVAASGVFAMVPSGDASRLNCYDVSADAGRLSTRIVDLSRLEPDSILVKLIDSTERSIESLAARVLPSRSGSWTADRLSSELIRGVLSAELADGFLCDSLLVSDFKEPEDLGDLVAVLRDPGRLAILSLREDELNGWPAQLVLQPGLGRAGLVRGQTYHIATTVDYLQRHPGLARPGFELSARPLWTMCVDILESGRVK